ncbi:MAG: Flp pilus assembly complex ATPase component TadA [Gammaproteobacteria bacterium]|nr:Flp pilus assembly complex ATPase component TadA [Gammaproteobacteria bacterium]
MTENVQKRIRIGDLLIEKGAITQTQLDAALAEQRKSGQKLGRALIDLGFIKEEDIRNILSSQLDIPFIDLAHFKFNPQLVRQLPEMLARRYRAIVLSKENDQLVVGMTDPTDIFAYDAIAKHLNNKFKQAIISQSELIKTFDLVYRRTDEITNFAQELGAELSEGDINLETMVAGEDLTDAPVVKLLQSMFEDAIQVGASDIHIEPDEKVLRIRQRIDGVLYEQVMEHKRIANALVMRLKIMSGLDISEKRLPQDGRFNIRVKDRSIDVRLSTMPVQYGESMVMRLLDQSGGMLELEHLGMESNMVNAFRKCIHSPHGLILVTGATGSGKSTTLYAALSELNQADKKIITAEDPVEYRLPRINQVQIHPKIDLGFSQVLRAALRQDPDIILIGEMRDQETAEIGIRASMTGHLVLSTLHTNDAMHTLERLLDMGVEGYLLATVLRAVVAQRLVRRVCDSCKQPLELDGRQKVWLKTILNGQFENAKFHIGAGCSRCNNTGYHGRIGIYEMFEPDEPMQEALRDSDINAFTKALQNNEKYVPLLQSGMELAAEGITSLREVMRFAGEYFQRDTVIANSYNIEDL